MKKEYTEYEKERIFQKPYISSTVLSEELGIPASTIRAYRKRVVGNIRERFEPPEDEFIENFEKAKSLHEMERIYNADRHTIKSYADRINYQMPINNRKLTEEQKIEIVGKYETNTAEELAREYKVSSSCISSIWAKNGKIGKTNRTYYLDEMYFKNIDSCDKAYFLGLIGSDGCIYHTKDTRQDILRISLQKEDDYILKLFYKCLKTDKPVIYTKDEKYANFEISSDIIVEDIRNTGLDYRKTYKNTIANVDRCYMPALIRGYFDGDGNISTTEKMSKDPNIGISGYWKNMKILQDYLQTRFIFTSFVVDKRKYQSYDEDVFGELTITNKTAKYSFLKLIYDNKESFYLPRKYELAEKFINHIESSDNVRDKQIVLYYKYAVCATS